MVQDRQSVPNRHHMQDLANPRDQLTDPNHSVPDFNFTMQHSQSQRSRRFYQTPSKTRGLELQNMPANQVIKGDLQKKSNQILYEEQDHMQFSKSQVVRRYVENIITGKFFNIKGSANINNLTNEQQQESRIQASRYQTELAILQQQHVWINRINQLYLSLLGFLGGMSLLHTILIAFIQDHVDFYDFYAPYSMMFNILFLTLTNFALIFCVVIAFVFKNQSEDQLRTLDSDRHKIRLFFTVQVTISVIMLIGLVSLYYLPKYTLVMFYSAKSKSTQELVTSIKISYYIANGALCICWILASIVSKGSISQLNIEVEELEAEETEEKPEN